MTIRALVLTGGHPFDGPSFKEMLDSLPGIEHEHVVHPAAAERLAPGRVDADVVVAYDLPGIRFRSPEPPQLIDPPASVVEGFAALIEEGQPFVFLHHAICSWPTWEGFADIVGGRFFYAPGSLRGEDWPDSGYRLDVQETLTVVAPDHPVCAGLPATFELEDESYLCPVFEDEVVPLIVTDYPRSDREHWSTLAAVTGRRDSNDGWHHPTASAYAAWVKRAGRSPVVYLQPGDGPPAFSDANYRRLLSNAIAWVASPEAAAWAVSASD